VIFDKTPNIWHHGGGEIILTIMQLKVNLIWHLFFIPSISEVCNPVRTSIPNTFHTVHNFVKLLTFLKETEKKNPHTPNKSRYTHH